MTLEAITGTVRNATEWTGDALRVWLTDRGLKQRELAEALETELRTVQRWLSGATAIPGPVRACLDAWDRLEDIHRLASDQK